MYFARKFARNFAPKLVSHFLFELAAMPELPKNHPGSRVVNGSSTGKPFPYQLQLKNNDRPWCGAVLISPRFALSAHHCITEVPNNPKKSLSLVAGAYTSWDSDEIGQVRNIKDINQLYHQDGSATQKPQDPDIVIIEVHEAFVMNTYVRPACLPTRKALPGETCIVSGWGITENMHPQEEDFDLQAAKLDVVPSDDVSFCKKMWKYYSEKYGKSEYVGEHSLCAFDSHSSACKGDSGGPLVCGTSGGAMIHGIVSFGNPFCKFRAEDNTFDEFDPYPSVFVDVYHFVDQIKPFIVSIFLKVYPRNYSIFCF